MQERTGGDPDYFTKNIYGQKFSNEIKQNKLVNLSSGIRLSVDIVENILNMFENGKIIANQFYKELLLSKKMKFHGT